MEKKLSAVIVDRYLSSKFGVSLLDGFWDNAGVIFVQNLMVSFPSEGRLQANVKLIGSTLLVLDILPTDTWAQMQSNEPRSTQLGRTIKRRLL